MLRLKPNRSQLAVGLVAALVLIIVGGLAWGFGQQLALARRMWLEEKRLEQAVAAAQARHDELLAQLEYVQSDEYVEYWARTEARMARPGEVLVVLPDGQDGDLAADAQQSAASEPESQPFWAELWELIFVPSD